MGSRDREFDEAEGSEMVYEPATEPSLKRWVLLEGNRLGIAGAVAGGVFSAVVALDAAGIFRVTDGGAVVTLLSALVGGTLPFITIVLAINQLVLSQELGWANELRSRFDGMTELRRNVERLTDTPVSPASPADFLALIVAATVERATALPDELVDGVDARHREAVRRFASNMQSEGEDVSEALEDAEFGTFDALSAVLGHHSGDNLYVARMFRNQRPHVFVDTEPLDELIELLESLAIARQTFKTLYVQHELAILSRFLLYVGFPTLVGGGLLVVVYPTLVEVVASHVLLLAVAAGGVTLVFLPFVVLLSYSLRIATIAARTADFGPFVPRVSSETD